MGHSCPVHACDGAVIEDAVVLRSQSSTNLLRWFANWCSSHYGEWALRFRLLRHRERNLNVQNERVVSLPLLVTKLRLPYAIVVRLHVRKSNVVILRHGSQRCGRRRLRKGFLARRWLGRECPGRKPLLQRRLVIIRDSLVYQAFFEQGDEPTSVG